MAIEYSRAAENDLIRILHYGIERYGIVQAERRKAGLDRNPQYISEKYKKSRA